MDKNYFEKYCTICTVEEPTHVFRPCNHKCICKSCALTYEDNSDKENFQKCPICRKKYKGIVRFDGDQHYLEQETILVKYATAISLKESQKAEEDQKQKKESMVKDVDVKTVKDLQRKFEKNLEEFRQSTISSNSNTTNPKPSTNVTVILPTSSTGTIPKFTKVDNRKDLKVATNKRYVPMTNVKSVSNLTGRPLQYNQRMENHPSRIYGSSQDLSHNLLPRQTSAPTGTIPKFGSRVAANFRGPMLPRAQSVNNLTFSSTSNAVAEASVPTNLANSIAPTIVISEFINRPTGNKTELSGRLTLNFPPGIIQALDNELNQEILKFRLKNINRIEITELNDKLLRRCYDNTTNDNFLFVIDLRGLIDSLKELAQKNPKAKIYGLLAFNYKIQSLEGTRSCPLIMHSTWTSDSTFTSLKIHYSYNPSAMDHPVPLKNVKISIKIEEAFDVIETTAQWIRGENQLLWNLSSIAHNGELNARFKFTDNNNISKQKTISADFFGKGTTLSGVKFVLEDDKYPIKDVSTRFKSGTYLCDNEETVQ